MKNKFTSRSPFRKLRVLICLALLCATPISVKATTITVTNTNDSGPGSLRQALADANDGDTITFAVTGTIQLSSGELLIDNSITISGPPGSVWLPALIIVTPIDASESRPRSGFARGVRGFSISSPHFTCHARPDCHNIGSHD